MSGSGRIKGADIDYPTSGVWRAKDAYEYGLIPVGQEEFTTAGAQTFTVPAGVTSVCVVCIGAGGGGVDYTSGAYAMHGGTGGGLGYKNDIAVTPGANIDVQVGAGGAAVRYNFTGGTGGDSYFDTALVCKGGGGVGGKYDTPQASGGDYVGDGGGNGGGTDQTSSNTYGAPGGGGAGGYSGNGGKGMDNGSVSSTDGDGAGGAGSGGGNNNGNRGYGGGGTGIYGEGASGVGNKDGIGKGGSSGGDGDTDGYGGNYGAGGGGACVTVTARAGTDGAVRVIWGPGRAFPSTNTGDM